MISLFAQKNDLIVVEKNQVVEEDFYAAGSVIEISGICKKDVYVAASQVVIDGQIEGDLICLCGSLQVTGRINGALRAITGQTLITGGVGKNITVASAAFTTTPTASCLSSLFVAASTVDIAGKFLQDLFVGASNFRYSGHSIGNLHLYAATIRIGAKAVVDGFIEYSSPNLIDVQNGAVIGKGLVEKQGPSKLYLKSATFNRFIFSSKVALALMNLFFTLLIGLLLFKMWPASFMRSNTNLKKNFLKSIGQGLLIVTVVPILGTVLLMTILGIPIAVTLIAFSILGLYTAKIYTLYYFAERLKHKLMKQWKLFTLFSLLCVLYFIVLFIPVVGIVLTGVFTLAGLGASSFIPKAIKKV